MNRTAAINAESAAGNFENRGFQMVLAKMVDEYGLRRFVEVSGLSPLEIGNATRTDATPSFEMVNRIIQATGHRIRIEPRD
jgi:DNA-binding phage protein